MIRRVAVLVLVAALGAGPAVAQEASAPLQTITLRLHNVPAEVQVQAERVGVGPVPLIDNGAAVLEGAFQAAPARSVHLRLVQSSDEGRIELWDGLALLPDRDSEVIAFEYSVEDRTALATRVAVAPTPRLASSTEPAGPYLLALGWGALVLAYVIAMVLAFTLRRRSSEPS